MMDFTDTEIRELERSLNDKLPESIEITSIYQSLNDEKDKVFTAAFSFDKPDNSEGKGTITFSCRRPNGKVIEDLKITHMTGQMKNIDQSIFDDEY